MVVAKCLKLIWNHSGIISGTYFSPFQRVYYLHRGLRRAPKPYFSLILEFWIIFLIFYEWIIHLNILDSFEWIFFWMNIPDFVWIESFLGPIQWKNEFSKRIGQGYWGPTLSQIIHKRVSQIPDVLWTLFHNLATDFKACKIWAHGIFDPKVCFLKY